MTTAANAYIGPSSNGDRPSLYLVTEKSQEYIDRITSGSDAEDAQRVTDIQTLHAARRLVTDVYLSKGYVKPEEVTVTGYINEILDPHVVDSTYYVRKRQGEVVATSRLIRKDLLADFPAFTEFGISTEICTEVDPDATHYREVSALAKAPYKGHQEDVLRVYAEMMKDSINTDGRYWLMSVDSKFSHKLKQLFGAKSFQQLGDEKFVMGSQTTPMMLDTHKALHLLEKRLLPKDIKRLFIEGLQGIDGSKVDTRTRAILIKHGVITETPEEKKARTRADRLERIAMGGLVGYTLLRAGVVPMTDLDQHGVNMAIFLGIDVATVPPYFKGLRMAGSEKSSKRRMLGGAALAGSAFLAPYAYIAAEAKMADGVPQALGIYASMLLATIGSKKVKEFRGRRSRTRQSLLPQQRIEQQPAD